MIWREMKVLCEEKCRRLGIRENEAREQLDRLFIRHYELGIDTVNANKNAVIDFFEYLEIIRKDKVVRSGGRQIGLLQ